MFDDDDPVLARVRAVTLALPDAVRVTHVPDTNHFSIVFGDEGIAAICDAVERLLDV